MNLILPADRSVSPDVPFRCELLGSSSIIAYGTPVSASPKQVALIAYLATSTNQVSRAELAHLLWPSSASRSARHSLSQAVYSLRAATDTTVIDGNPDILRLGAIRTDVQDFHSSYVEERWVTAASLYGGDFLHGCYLKECVEFSQWVDRTRTRYRIMGTEVLERLFSEQRWDMGFSLANVLLSGDPDNVRLRAMRIAILGEMEGASAAEAALKGLSEADRATIEASYGQLTTGSNGETSTFVGRATEIQRFNTEIELTEETGLRIVILEGSAGSGKTALANRFAKLRVLRGDVALVARATEAEQHVPFGIVDQWLQMIPQRFLHQYQEMPWWNVLRAVFPSLANERPEELADPISQRRLLEALRRLALSLAKDNRVVFVIDDAHFSDNASIAFLSYLTGRSRTEPVLILLTRRTDRRDIVCDFHGDLPMSVVNIEPLSAIDISTWLSKIGRSDAAQDQATISALLARTGGNPLLLSSLLQDGIDQSDAGLPASILEHYKPKLLRLSTAARSMVVAMAITGEVVSDDFFAEALGRDSAAAAAVIAELLDSHLAVRDTAGFLTLQHGLIGEAAVLMTNDAEKRRLHGRTARLFERRDTAGTAMAAVSHDIAGNRSAAYAAAMQAADACAVLNAHEERLFFLKLAVTNAPDQEASVRARIALSEVLLRLGRAIQSREALSEDLIRGCSPETLVQAQMQLILSGVTLATNMGQVTAYWQQAQRLAEPAPTQSVAAVFSEIASVAHDLGSDQLAMKVIAELRKLLERMPRSPEQSELLLRPIMLAGMIGDFSDAFEELRALSPASEGRAEYACKLHASRGTLLVSAGEVTAAAGQFSEALFVAERHGLYDHLFLTHNNLAVCLIEQGKYAEAEEELMRAQQYGSPETFPTLYSIAADNTAILFFESQRYQEALQVAHESLENRTATGRRSLLHSYSIIGLSQLALGRLAKAREAHREVRLLDPDRSASSGDASYIYLFNARMLVATEEAKAAVAYLEGKAAEHMSVLALCRWRLELEACRLRLLLGLPLPRADELVAELADTGAAPLLDLATSFQRRAALAQSR